MKKCSSCSRPLLPVAQACPFCGARLSAKWMTAATAAVVTPFVLSACYGGPPVIRECDDVDFDGDGFWTESFCFDDDQIDCDDGDPDVNPGAAEVCDDGVDNNCDGILAGASQDEVCGNGLDDDCDGEVDEAPDTPGSEVLCDDGIDNDCDGLIDLDDPNCLGIPDADSDTATSGDVAIAYAFVGPNAVFDCAEAGLALVSVDATGPESIAPFNTACDDTPVALNALANGEWSIALSATSSMGDEWSGSVQQVTVAGDVQTVVVDLVCVAADGTSPCDVGADGSR